MITVIRDDRPFNYSALNNMAAEQARGDLLLLLNDDVEVLSGDWLEEMVSQILQAGVGVVGAKLDYPDGTIQHAGVTLGIHGAGRAPAQRAPTASTSGTSATSPSTRRVSAVTGALHVDPAGGLWDDLGGLGHH